jgi:hypothetical protein
VLLLPGMWERTIRDWLGDAGTIGCIEGFGIGVHYRRPPYRGRHATLGGSAKPVRMVRYSSYSWRSMIRSDNSMAFSDT